MKKMLKILGYTLATLLLVLLTVAAVIHFKGVPTYDYAPPEHIAQLKVELDSARIERGAKIASILCAECHTGSGGKMTGRPVVDLPAMFGNIVTLNITHDKEKGIGNWTDGELYYFLRTGIRKDGSWAPPFMPKYPLMADEDVQSIIAWLRSDDPRLEADSHEYAANQYNLLVKILSRTAFTAPPLPGAPIALPDTTDKIALGKYLSDAAFSCFVCHSESMTTFDLLVPERSKGFYGGGNPMQTPDGKIVNSANLTMDKETGLGNWTSAQFVDAVRFCKKPTGGSLSIPMMPHTALTDAEVEAIWAYLQTVPVIKNPVVRFKGN